MRSGFYEVKMLRSCMATVQENGRRRHRLVREGEDVVVDERQRHALLRCKKIAPENMASEAEELAGDDEGASVEAKAGTLESGSEAPSRVFTESELNSYTKTELLAFLDTYKPAHSLSMANRKGELVAELLG